MVRLRDSLSNPDTPLSRLLDAWERRSISNSSVDLRNAIADQIGTTDERSIRFEVKENRKLSHEEIAELVDSYKSGATQVSLSLMYGVHEQTVKAHLKRQGIKTRPVHALTDQQESEVERLYVEKTWSMEEIAVRFKIGEATARSILVRRNVTRRASTRRPIDGEHRNDRQKGIAA